MEVRVRGRCQSGCAAAHQGRLARRAPHLLRGVQPGGVEASRFRERCGVRTNPAQVARKRNRGYNRSVGGLLPTSERMTVSNVLYVNADGKNVTHTSYSSRSTFKKCPRQFQLERIHGWWSKENRAAPLFGKCIEAGLQAFEENDRRSESGVKVFRKLWEDVKLIPEFKDLIYTATENDWDQLMKSGTEMMLLYEVRAPRLPINKPIFQQKLRKTIFPGTNLAMLE